MSMQTSSSPFSPFSLFGRTLNSARSVCGRAVGFRSCLADVATAFFAGVLLLWCAAAQAGLIAFYSFDDPLDPSKDDGPFGYHLAPGVGLTDPVYVPNGGVEGGAYAFNGEQHWVAPVNINTGYLPYLTMGAWVKTSTLAASNRKIMGHDDGGYDRTLGLDVRNGPFRYVAFIGTGDPPPGGPSPKSTNDWTFVAVTYDDWSGEMTLYVDLDTLSIGDALEISSSLTGFTSGQDSVAIGSIRPDNTSEGWVGMIDNVFFYDEVLTAEQLTALRDGGKTAILGSGGDDPDLRVISEPVLRDLPKAPPVLSFSYGIKNLGTTKPLTISSVTPTGPDAARYTVTGFPASLAPGASGTINFTLDSKGELGTFTAALVVGSNDPSNPTVSLDVSAQVGDDPDLTITSAPNLQELAKLPVVQTLGFGIRNTGVFEPLVISKITISGLDAAYFTVKSFPATLAPGAQGQLDITFDNQGQVGTFSAIATIESNDASNPQVTCDLTARVVSNSLLAFYSFDDPANPTKDDSGFGRALQSAGAGTAPTYRADGGVTGGAYDFNGSQRWVSPLNINPSQVEILTMGAWVRTTRAFNPGLYKVMGHDNGGYDRVIGLDNRSGAFRYAAFTGTGITLGNPPPTPLGTDEWTFLAAVYDHPNKRVRLYVDLDVASIDDDPQEISATTSMGAGASTTAIGAIAPGGGEGWQGTIDNAFFLAGRIDSSVIKAIRDQGKDALLQFRPDPVLVVPATAVFGDLPGPNPVTASIEIRNSGASRTLTIAEARLSGRNASKYTVTDVPKTIEAGASALLKVRFDPQGQEGSFECTLDLISNSTADRHTLLDLSAFVPYTTPLIAFYPFDDPANPLRDVTGKGADLVAPSNAAPTYQPAGGITGGAYLFNGLQRLISSVDINPARLPRLTMGAWVRTDSLVPGWRKVLGHDNGGYDRTIGLDTRVGAFNYVAFTGTGLLGGGVGPVDTSTWTFLAASYDRDAGKVTLYIDPDVSAPVTPLLAVEATGNFGPGFPTTAIGGLRPDNADEGWQGSIDNVFFYQTVLSPEQLASIRDGGADAILPPAPPRPEITSVQRTTTLTIVWASAAGKTYVVEYAERLLAGWTRVATVTGQRDSTTYVDSDPTRLARPIGFYRVGLQP